MRRGVWAGLAVLAVGVAAGVAWWSGRPARQLAEAARLVRAGQAASALDWLAVPEASAATRDRALLLRAEADLALGRVTEAAEALRRVDPKGPGAIDLGFWKGRTLYQAGQSRTAITWFQGVLVRRPDDLEALRWLAAAAYDLGDRTLAVAALEGVTRLRPGEAPAWRTLALIHKENAQYERAEAAYSATLRSDPDQPRVRLEAAETLMKLGRLDEALAALELCRGRVDEAKRLDLRATCLRLAGDADGHRAAVDAGLALAPRHPGLLAQRARLDLAEGRAESALARLDLALAIDPSNEERLYQRGTTLRALGRADAAARDLARAGDLKRSLAELSALNDEADKHPDDAEVRYQLGARCDALGKPALAASWYRAALACDPAHGPARRALGRRAVSP